MSGCAGRAMYLADLVLYLRSILDVSSELGNENSLKGSREIGLRLARFSAEGQESSAISAQLSGTFDCNNVGNLKNQTA
jgi:hypothetical protein